ncbi:hypothetical protein [Sandaracinus amylolyticus]|uniref:hypothetical protein n=1 Tax=Sandaracinus amylolyticus TaxID=927083 RepID=UPI001F15F6D7|nr:hypothetical protein [Sandaracinus amylolyticus]UJR85188.1 Hypothetical protein I5071_72680 [Sandaracinus amylolyticus]
MIGEGMQLRLIGYWRSVNEHDSSLPDPRDFIDPEWDESERARVIDYLRQGRTTSWSPGFSRCRLCGSSNGSKTLTDGTFVWPEGFAHYVAEHAVKPPQEILEHVWRELDRIARIEPDVAWWREQRGVAKARHWLRWRVEIGPCDLRATNIIQQIAGGVLGWDRAERIYTELSRKGTARITLSDRGLADEVRERLTGARVACTIVEERVPAPDTLLG